MNMNRFTKLLTVLAVVGASYACNTNSAVRPDDAQLQHNNQHQLTEVIIYDGFTPPVASRIYVYSSLAAYEAVRYLDPKSVSIAEKLNGFGKMPVPEKGMVYDYSLASLKAFFTVVRNVKVFSVDSLKAYEEKNYKAYEALMDKSAYDRSIAFGDTIAKAILARAKKDGYAASRGKEKFLGSNDPGMWRPTPPDYLDGVEWCWNTMKSMTLDSASQFMPPRPPAFSKDPKSEFYKYAKEVYDINKGLTEEQKTIAKYWDDNPFVIEHSGHMMFANKKITPGGHWMGIAGIASALTKADPVKTARAYALTAVAMFDGFIACWDEKYRSKVVRPVTVINEWFDPHWAPFLQTPPFPEYTSGHSTISAAAATVLTDLFGPAITFKDTVDLKYIGMQREFNSFYQAADEASISRVYGGIHYRTGVDAGGAQGRQVGVWVLTKLRMNN